MANINRINGLKQVPEDWAPPSYDVSFPQSSEDATILQDAECFDIVVKQRIRIHDYRTLYSYPGLYESVYTPISPYQLIQSFAKVTPLAT